MSVLAHAAAMTDNAISIHAFVAVPDETAARAIRSLIEINLSQHGPIARSEPPRRYWKIPELFEIFVIVQPPPPVSNAFVDLLRELGSGWDEHRFADGGDWAVWNPSPTATFSIPEVRWAHLECSAYPVLTAVDQSTRPLDPPP